MAANLLQSKRQEFLNALSAVRPNNRFKVVVVDRRSLNVLNHELKLSEVYEHDVVRIEKIENNRKDDPSVEALYFLTPSKQSVARLIADFAPGVPSQSPAGGRGFSSTPASKPTRYRAAHVFFTSELPNSLLAMVKSSGITPFIKALKEMCIEYDATDSRVFLTKLVDRPFYRLYSPVVARGFNDELELISKKLANVCGALKENPVVRYLLLDQDIHGDTKARPLAFLFHTEMERIREVLPVEDDASGRRPPTELIIVDRSADPFAPVLHEFTYEAMVHDLLDIEDGNKFTYTAQLANGTEEVKTVTLNESDSVWQEFRFQHISDAQQGILKKFQALVGSNRDIVGMQSGERVDLSRMRDVVNNMPQFKDQMSLIASHITIMQRCMDQFEKLQLSDLGLLEQNLAMGMTPEGEKYKSGDIDIAYVLNNPSIASEDKLRLLLIFFISNPALTDSERQKLAHLAKLSREARETIKSMGLVIRWMHALDLLRQIKHRPSQQAKGAGLSKWGLASMRAAATGSSQQASDDEPKPYDVSRYVPAFKSILEGCVEGNLSEDLFPYVVPPERPRDSSGMGMSARTTPTFAQGERTGSPASSMWSSIANSVGLQTQPQESRASSVPSQGSAQKQIKSLRTSKPTWQKRDSTPSVATTSSSSPSGAAGGMAALTTATAGMSLSPTAPQGQARSKQQARARVILFVIGGVTYSEVRAAEEISAKYNREVIVGSTHIVEPSAYLKEVSSLAFEIIGDDGRVLNMQPSFYALGYGGPEGVDPLARYDEELAKAKPKPKPVPAKAEEPSRQRAAPDGERSRHSPSRSRSRSRSQGRDRQSDREAAAAEYRPYDGAGSSHSQQQQQQQRSAGRVGAHPGNGNVSSEYREPRHQQQPQRQPQQQHSMSASSSRGSLRAPTSGRGGYDAPPGASSHSSGSNHSSRDHLSSSSRQTHHSGRPDYGHAGGEPQNFRAGYEEYRQQQQQQASRSRSHHGSPSPMASRSAPPQPPPQQYAPRQPVAPPLSKEEVFRAKFEQSQTEWNAQRTNMASINPANISDMHKVTLAHGGGGGRARSGSATSGEKKPSFLKRIL
ncbi:syntaxin binding protein 1 [Coemansia spiralis]|uniref:Syntaxin binding protein 1 n=1 Tax=Coemansia spiralis TaxID=417178 RepID=A0A9W8L260_9FUNG|nr:syntaxin binding protein 1 [Coemansia spiralis]